MKNCFIRIFIASLLFALLICNTIIPVNAISVKEAKQPMPNPTTTITNEASTAQTIEELIPYTTEPTGEAMNPKNMVENTLQSLIVNDSLSRIGWALAMFIIALALIGWAFGQITQGFAQLIIALTGVYTAVVRSMNPIIKGVDMALTKTIHYCQRFNTIVNTKVITRLSATTDSYLLLVRIAAVTSIPFVIMAAWSLTFINSTLNIGTTLSLLLLGSVLAYPPIKIGMLAWTKYLSKDK